jgi:hypothetical protein
MKSLGKGLIFVVLIILLFSFGCGGGGGGSDNNGNNNSSGSTVISGAAVKGLIKGGTVSAYALVDGQKGTLLGTTTTSSTDGTYSINVGSYTGPVLLEVRGGTYRNEATSFDEELQGILRAALDSSSGEISAAITPLTDLAVQLAGPTNSLTPETIDAANKMISQLLGGTGAQDIITQTIPIDASTGDAGTLAQKEYGLLLAAIAQMAKDRGITVTSAINAIAEDLQDLKLDSTGTELNTALATFCANPYLNKTGLITSPANLVTALETVTTTGLSPTGDMATVKEYLATFLEDPSDGNYDTFMNYMQTFTPPSKEGYLFTAIAQLFTLYTQGDISIILSDLPGGGVNLDTDFINMTDQEISNIITALITTDNLDKTLAAAINRLDAIDSELALAEGVKTSISLTGFDTVCFDDVDVKLLRTLTMASKAALTYLQAVNLTSISNWNVSVRSHTYNYLDLFNSDDYEALRHNLTDEETANIRNQFLDNNPNLFTYRSGSATKLTAFKTYFAQAVSRYGTVMDAMNAIGSIGRNNRYQNAFNISSDMEFQNMMAVKEHTLPSIIAAFDNSSAGLKLVNSEDIDRRYVVKDDGYAYKQITSDVYFGTYTHAPGTISINGLISGATTPRDLIQEYLANDAYEMYTAPVGSDTDIWWTNWTLYAHSATEIEWDKPIETYTVPVAAISVTDGLSSDWATVPIFFENNYHIVKLARDSGNNFYIYYHEKASSVLTGYWYLSKSFSMYGSYPVINGQYARQSIYIHISQSGNGSTVYSPYGDTSAYSGTELADSGEIFTTVSNIVVGAESKITGGYSAIAGLPGSCHSYWWSDYLSSEGSTVYSSYYWTRQVKFLPEIN